LADFKEFLREREDSLNSSEDYHNLLKEFVASQEIGFGKIGQPLRVALLGELSGSGLDEIMSILGVEETIDRIERVLSLF